jgi:large subunit ribosomal protein L29
MNIQDLVTKSPDELKTLLLEQRKAQMNVRFQRAGGQLEKTHEIRGLRRSIARIKTLLSGKAKPAKAASAPAKTKSKKAAAKG